MPCRYLQGIVISSCVAIVFFCAKKDKIRGENDAIFGWGFLIWMPIGTKHVLSADCLFLYERSGIGISWHFYTVSKSTLTPSCFGVNEGVEYAGMQCSYCVSMSELPNIV
jgi:hypothetical protein